MFTRLQFVPLSPMAMPHNMQATSPARHSGSAEYIGLFPVQVL